MKNYLIIALCGLAFASCSNLDESATGETSSNDEFTPAFISPVTNSETRNALTYDLQTTWTDGDEMGAIVEWKEDASSTTSTFIPNGKTNAMFKFHGSFTYGGYTYTNSFAQYGLLTGEGGLSSADKVAWNATPDATHFTSLYNWYMYYPYSSATTVSKTAVPFSLSNTQTQTTPNEWNAKTACYNFMWDTETNLCRPADRKVPMKMKRLLPVAEFNIVRDDATLDGYNLTGITMTPTDATKPMPSGAVTNGINLEGLASCTSLTFGESAASFTLDNKGDGSGIAVTSVDQNKSFSTYMSVAPAASKEYKLVATFSNGTKTKAITITRSDEFTIAAGKGNIVRYYFKSSYAKDPGDAINDGYSSYIMWTPNPPITDCPSYNEITWYLSVGAYWDDGTATEHQSYTLTNTSGVSTVYHTGLWLKKKQYIDGFTKDAPAKNASGTVITNATQGTGGFHNTQTDLNTIDKSQYFFLPAAGYFWNGSLPLCYPGTYGGYWSSTPNGTDAWLLYFYNGNANVLSNRNYFGYSVWVAQ